jgi:hypothetical protein
MFVKREDFVPASGLAVERDLYLVNIRPQAGARQRDHGLPEVRVRAERAPSESREGLRDFAARELKRAKSGKHAVNFPLA